MKIVKIADVLFYSNLYWVKYSVILPNGKQELRSVSFRELEIAKQFQNSIKNKIYV